MTRWKVACRRVRRRGRADERAGDPTGRAGRGAPPAGEVPGGRRGVSWSGRGGTGAPWGDGNSDTAVNKLGLQQQEATSRLTDSGKI